MIKMIFIVALCVLCVLLVSGILFLNLSPMFGAKYTKKDAERIRKSPQYKDGKFRNIEKTPMMTDFIFSSIPKYFTKGDRVPEILIPVEKLPLDYFDTNMQSQKRITWFGHSSILIEFDGKKIFLDPMFGNVISPVFGFGLKRFNPELPLDEKNLPVLDAVIISHDHHDHLDYKTILKIKDKVQKFIVPLGVGAHLESWGVDRNKIIELDLWEEINLNSITIAATPARHFSGRGLFDRDNTLWASWVIKGENGNLFYSGDSGYTKLFKEIGEKYGPFDLTMLDCGQYDEQWAHAHMMPEQGVQANIDLQGKVFFPIHWGSFKLALHKWSEPAEKSLKKASEMKVKVALPKIGQPIVLGKPIPLSKWWEAGRNSKSE